MVALLALTPTRLFLKNADWSVILLHAQLLSHTVEALLDLWRHDVC